jgi:putative ABC transport system permease protein
VTILQDVRFAFRMMAKEPWFTTVVLLVLAFGLGINTAVFTLVNGALVRSMPFDEPDRVVWITLTDPRGRGMTMSLLDFQDYRRDSKTFSQLGLTLYAPMNVSDAGRPAEQFIGTYTSSSIFTIIGQRPIVGRDFTADDDRVEAEPAAIIGYTAWQDRYGGDPQIIGHALKVNGRPYTVIGVMGPDMKFPMNNEIWLPYQKLPPESLAARRNVRNSDCYGRLVPGVTLAQAQAEFDTLAARLSQAYPDTDKDLKPRLVTVPERERDSGLRLVFLSLMGAVAFVLLIACANVANLLLARSANRSHEIAVRLSLGASRWQVVRQLLIESTLLSVIGGVLGLVVAVGSIRWFDAALDTFGRPYWMKFPMDATVFVFLAAICVGTGVLFGLAPALHITRTDVAGALKEGGGRTSTGGHRVRRWANALIVVELALTIVLLAGAGFMVRSFLTFYAMERDTGVDTRNVVTMNLFLPLRPYSQPDLRTALARRIDERLAGVPAVQSASLMTSPPLLGGYTRRLSIDGRPDVDPESRPEVTMVAVTPRYFETFAIPVLRGRAFDRADGTAGHESVMVNERFVALHFSGEDPLGRRITLYDPVPATQQSPPRHAAIIGIVPNVKQRDFTEPIPDPVAYLPFEAESQRSLTLVVKSREPLDRLTPVLREQMRLAEPDLPLFNMMTMDAMLAQTRWQPRVFSMMFAAFALMALVLSSVGLYAVTAYSVTQRLPEFGLRIAIGAEPRHVLWLVLRRALAQLAIGLPIGIAGASAVGRLMQSMLLRTSASDPATMGGIVLIIVSVSVAAAYWPARRATKVDPVVVLR